MRTRRVTSGSVIGNVSVGPSWHPTVYKPIVPRLFYFSGHGQSGGRSGVATTDREVTGAAPLDMRV